MVLCARHTPPCGEVKICWNRVHKSIGEIENVRMRTSFFFFFLNRIKLFQTQEINYCTSNRSE